jgi:hypothetical protein
MTESVPGSIPRRLEPSAFDQLRADLLSDVQQLTAHQWTDYNLHDPGITILEQLAFALSDLNYRSAYPVATLLADRSDQVELNTHGMFAPEDAFVCRSVSQRDLQKALLNAIPELAYVKVHYSNAIAGLVDLSITAQDKQVNRTKLIDKVRRVYHQQRNLSENLDQVKLINSADARLTGTIEIARDALPEQVMANIYFTAQRFLLGDIDRTDYQTQCARMDGVPYDGPRMSRHFINDDGLIDAEKNRPLSALIERLMAIDGVVSVRQLAVVEVSDNDVVELHSHFLKSTRQQAFYLALPEFDIDSDALTLQQQGSLVELDKNRFQHEFHSLYGHYKNRRDLSSMPTKNTTWPGQYSELTDYSSIQGHFPNNYGINAFGVPSYSDDKRKAQARQLQGYLLLFDQIMNDHLHMLDNIKQLFSIDIDDIPHHPASQVSDENAYDLASLYQKKQGVDFFNDEFHDSDHKDHKRHILEYLLAVNGRDKAHYANDLFNPFLDSSERQYFQLQCRQIALTHIHEWSEHRGGGADLMAVEHEDQLSALEKRLRLLLAGPLQRTSLLPTSLSQRLQSPTADDEIVENSKKIISRLIFRDIASPLRNWVDDDSIVVPHLSVDLTQAHETVAQYLRHPQQAMQTLWHNLQLYGAALNRYRITQLFDRRSIELLVNLADENQPPQWYYLGSFKDRDAPKMFANHLRQVLLDEYCRLNGLHLIEHLPLLPRAVLQSAASEREQFIEQNPFYCHQLTAVLPDYTLRNKSHKFRHYVRGQVMLECPAHLHCHLLWLNETDMQTFEHCFFNWQQSLADGLNNSAAQAATVLVKFLMSRLPAELTQGEA